MIFLILTHYDKITRELVAGSGAVATLCRARSDIVCSPAGQDTLDLQQTVANLFASDGNRRKQAVLKRHCQGLIPTN